MYPEVEQSNSERVARALRAALPSNATVSSGAVPGGFSINGVMLSAVWVGDGRLRDVREVLRRADLPNLIAGGELTAGARAEIATAGIGWVDETGAAEFALGTIVVVRPGFKPSAVGPSGWTNAALAVAEAVASGVEPIVAATVEATGLSTGACIKALRLFTDLRLLVSDAARGRASGRRLADRDRFLDAYATASIPLRKPTTLAIGVTWQDTLDQHHRACRVPAR